MRLTGETTSPLVRALTLDAITEQSPEWLWVLPAVAALDPQALHRFCDQLL